MPTFTADPSSTYTYTPSTLATVELYGAGGGVGSGFDRNTDGGRGGYVSIEVPAGTTLEIAVGEGANGTTGGGSPAGNGGNGGDLPFSNGAGAGGGATVVTRQSDGAELAAAGAGGGGESQINDDYAGGGGGARGGLGGSSVGPDATAGGDADGSGVGGDGADGQSSNSGEDGGTATGGGVTVNTTQTGGGNAGDAVVEVTPIQPDPPSNVSQTVTGDDAIDVSWTGDETASEYEVEVSEDGGAFETVTTTSQTSITYSATPAANSHRFRVRATNAGGASGWSYTDTKSTDPSGLTASGDAFAPISLGWDAAPDATTYRIYRSTTSGTGASDYTQIATTSSTTYDDDVAPLETFYYRVQAVYSGTDSQLSEEASALRWKAPVIDQLDAATPREIDVSWSLRDDSSSGEVEIYRSTDGSLGSLVKTIADPSTTQWTDTGLQDGTEYHYTVRRVVGVESADSGQQSATTILPAPTGLVVNDVRADEADVSFRDNADNKQGYRAYVGEDGYLEFNSDGSVDVPHTSEQNATQSFTVGVVLELDGYTDKNTGNSSHHLYKPKDWFFIQRGSGGIRTGVRSDGTRQGVTGESIPVGERTVVMMTVDGSTITQYVNGSQTQQDSYTGSLKQSSNRLRIGNASGFNYGTNGRIFQLQVWQGAANASEASAWANGETINPGPLSLAAYFNQGSGDTLTDYSGKSNHGTLQDNPTWVGGGPVQQDGGDLSAVDWPRYWSKTGYAGDVTLLGLADGFNTVGELTTVDGVFDDIFTSRFTRSDFPDHAGDGNYIRLAFYAKWPEIPDWGEKSGNWTKKPDPNPNSYQYYELRSDADNFRNEYFRVFYNQNTSGFTARIGSPDVWKEGEDAPYRTIRHTLSDLENGEAYVTRASVFTDDTEVFDN